MATTQEIIRIAEWAVARARKLLPLSSNFPDPEHQLSHRALYLELARHRSTNQQQKRMVNELYEWHLDILPNKERYPLNDSYLWMDAFNKFMHFKSILGEVKTLPTLKSKYKDKDELLYLEGIISKAIKFGIGNCDELTALTAMLLFEYPQEGLDDLPKLDEAISVESVSINMSFPNDHAFLILNRKQDSKLDDIASWNNDVVICDPWSQEVYTKEEFLKKMDNETQQFMQQKFKSLSKNILTKDSYYIGEQYNKRIHTDHWYKKSNSQYWYPHKVLDLQERPVFSESLPKMEHRILPVKLGTYSLDLIENAKQIPEFFELFGGLQPIISFAINTDKATMRPCLDELQQRVNTKTPPYEFPLLFNMSHGKEETNLVFYKSKWVVFDGKNKFFIENSELSAFLLELEFFDKPATKLTLNVSRGIKDLNRATALLQPWYDEFSCPSQSHQYKPSLNL